MKVSVGSLDFPAQLQRLRVGRRERVDGGLRALLGRLQRRRHLAVLGLLQVCQLAVAGTATLANLERGVEGGGLDMFLTCC